MTILDAQVIDARFNKAINTENTFFRRVRLRKLKWNLIDMVANEPENKDLYAMVDKINEELKNDGIRTSKHNKND